MRQSSNPISAANRRNPAFISVGEGKDIADRLGDLVVAERRGIDHKIRRLLIERLSFPEQSSHRLGRIFCLQERADANGAPRRCSNVDGLAVRQTTVPSSCRRATFSGRITTPPPVTMIDGWTTSSFSKTAALFFAKSFFAQSGENFADRHLERGRDHLSVSKLGQPSCDARSRPTADLPVPMKPIRTIERLAEFTRPLYCRMAITSINPATGETVA